MNVQNERPECLKCLIENGAIVTAVDNNDILPIHFAAGNIKPDCLNVLMEKTPNINVKDGKGRTPLHWAAEQLSLECLKILIKNPKIEKKAKNKNGKIALDLVTIL
jgi:ankyrin repeat protein